SAGDRFLGGGELFEAVRASLRRGRHLCPPFGPAGLAAAGAADVGIGGRVRGGPPGKHRGAQPDAVVLLAPLHPALSAGAADTGAGGGGAQGDGGETGWGALAAGSCRGCCGAACCWWRAPAVTTALSSTSWPLPA